MGDQPKTTRKRKPEAVPLSERERTLIRMAFHVAREDGSIFETGDTTEEDDALRVRIMAEIEAIEAKL